MSGVNLPGVQFVPSNGADGYAFIEEHCCNCALDAEMGQGKPFDECQDHEICEVLCASFRPGGAIEWRELADGSLLCTAFVPNGQRRRCTKTRDMFA